MRGLTFKRVKSIISVINNDIIITIYIILFILKGQQARDALLMIMQLSARNPNLAKYIVENTDFCPVK